MKRDGFRYLVPFVQFDNVKNLKATLLHGCFRRFLNCTNSTKLRRESHKEATTRHQLSRPSFPSIS